MKRNFEELYINNYNAQWLEAWDANLDLQFCCDTYAVITYICDYYSKDETGMTYFLKETIKSHDLTRGNAALLNQIKTVYLSHRQVSSCEATYRLLPQLHLKDSNITTIFVSSGFPENRYKLLKFIDDSPPNVNDEDFVAVSGRQGRYSFTKSIHDRYSQRPDSLDDLCLAEFAINYSPVWNDSSNEGRKVIQLKNKFGQMKLRRIPSVIRLHESYKKTVEHEFYYSECLLFYPWRNETADLHRESPVDCMQLYKQSTLLILENKRKIFPHFTDEPLLQQCLDFDQANLRAQHIADMLDPQGTQQNMDDKIDRVALTYTYRHPGDFDVSIECSPKLTFPKLQLKCKSEIHADIRSLDFRQRIVFDHVAKFVHDCTRGNPVETPRLIVQGEAGTGKSRLINCLMSYAVYEFAHAGGSLEKPSALAVAPTGMAASLINGTTIHSAFNFSFGNLLSGLSDASLDHQRNILGDLRLLIVDEMSMVRSDLLYQIHERLQQIRQNNMLFGNVAILLLGDLLQLKPVQGKFIFERPSNQKYADFFEFNNLWQSFDVVVLNELHRSVFCSIKQVISLNLQLNVSILCDDCSSQKAIMFGQKFFDVCGQVTPRMQTINF